MELTPQPIEYSLLFANARLDFSFCLKLWRDGAFLVSISRLFHRHIPSGRKDFLKDCSLVLGLIYAVYMPYICFHYSASDILAVMSTLNRSILNFY